MNSAICLSSDLLGAGTFTVVPRKSMLSGVLVITDNVNTATVTVYDNASTATGKVLAKASATTTTGANSLAFVTPIRADLGITVVVAGTGTPQAIIYYDA